ncbi:hypothetical protein LINPERHAP2_LOCUS3338 [Linum perenne]
MYCFREHTRSLLLIIILPTIFGMIVWVLPNP